MDKLIEIALLAGFKASKKVLEIYKKDFEINYKSDKSPVTEADLASSKIIEEELEVIGFPVISEENSIPDYEIRKNQKSYFLIDPIDGTKEFINKTGEFCINIALVENSIPTLGFIFDPLNNLVIFGGSYLDEARVCTFDLVKEKLISQTVISPKSSSIQSEIRLTTSRRANIELLKNNLVDLLEGKKITILTKGSALKFIDLALDNADVYPRFGNTMEWDIAPGFAILKQLGGTIKEWKTGKDMSFNKENLLNPPFIAYNRRYNE